ncbi:MAG: hypothetical protein ACD_81C00058G0004 [uncultured bacterium]|nr:MAG: hypothetical protein ACD_81C00058G0004 [uncultured bacterium]
MSKIICGTIEVMRSAIVIKRNSGKQRGDVLLTKEIARALVQRVLSGETLYPSNRKIELLVGGIEDERAVVLSTNTLDSWCKRGNVIPETANELRAVLDKAKLDYRTNKREELKDKVVRDAERELTRTLNIRSNIPVRDRFGKVITNSDGSYARKENINLLRIKVDTAKFVLERLAPERYGKVGKVENKPLSFSLADLRRAKEEQDRAEPGGIQ